MSKGKKKVKENAVLDARKNTLLNDLRLIIENMDEKRGKLFLDWLELQNKYLIWEESFDPTRLRKYNRAEIVLANFGFNTGSEYGGMHYAVVVDDNKKSNPVVNVVPLSSLEENETEEDVHPDDVYLGEIKAINDKKAIALPAQIRAISKLRIFKPRKAVDDVYKLPPDKMDIIDKKIVQLFTKIKLNQ